MFKRLLDWDRDTFIYLNNLGDGSFDLFWTWVTDIYLWFPLYLLFFYLIYTKFPRREAIQRAFAGLALLAFVLVFTHLVKEYIARIRPSELPEMAQLIRILKRPGGFSFFSGHAATSFSLTTLMVLFLRKKVPWIGLTFIWPLLFSYSRIYVGVHYPLDIGIGAMVGICCALVCYGVFKRLTNPAQGESVPYRE